MIEYKGKIYRRMLKADIRKGQEFLSMDGGFYESHIINQINREFSGKSSFNAKNLDSGWSMASGCCCPGCTEEKLDEGNIYPWEKDGAMFYVEVKR